MTDLQRTARVAELQSYLRNQPRLKLEFLANMSRLFRDHDIDMPHDVLGALTLTLDRPRNASNGHVNDTMMNGKGSDDMPPPAPTHEDDAMPPPAPTHEDLDEAMPPPAPTHEDDAMPPPAPTHEGFDDAMPPPAPTS